MKTFWRNFNNKPGWFIWTIISLITLIILIWHMIDRSLYLYTIAHFPDIAISIFLRLTSVLFMGSVALFLVDLAWKTFRKILYLQKLKEVEARLEKRRKMMVLKIRIMMQRRRQKAFQGEP